MVVSAIITYVMIEAKIKQIHVTYDEVSLRQKCKPSITLWL